MPCMGDAKMDQESSQLLFHDGLYKKAMMEIGTLREKLPEDAFASLAREVIRRLSDHPAMIEGSVAFPTDVKIDELTHALMEPDAQVGIEFVERVRNQGASVETLYITYLAEAAKNLGTLWEEDKITFTDVTVATGHIYAIMRGLKLLLVPTGFQRNQPCAYFTAVPGEHHMLGVSMAADLFRKNGWDIALKRGQEHDEIVHYATTARIPLIGLSAGGEHALIPLARLVIALRINVPEAAIMVSGAILDSSRANVQAMGVDIIPESVDDALNQARDVWDQSMKLSQVG